MSEESNKRPSQQSADEHNLGEPKAEFAHEGSRRRSRHRRKRKKARTKKMLIIALAIVSSCVLLVMIGALVGVNLQSGPPQNESYREALLERRQAHDQQLRDCEAAGYLPWTCRRFDQAHFANAEKFDEFRCKLIKATQFECQYTLGSAKVTVIGPEASEGKVEYRATAEKPSAVVNHSDHDDEYFISISDKGYVIFRRQGQTAGLFAINPLTGRISNL